MTDGGVPEESRGRLSLPGWVQLVLGSHVRGEIAFGAPNLRLLPNRWQLHRWMSR